MKTIICAPITEPSLDAAVSAANSTKADIVELRLDYLEGFNGLEAIKGVNKPVMATCMPEWEGGRFSGTEEERMALLKDACRYARYVSVELATKKELRDSLIKAAHDRNVLVVVSHHVFNKTPHYREIEDTIKEEKKAGADVAKVAYMAEEYGDVLRVMRALSGNKSGIPIIAVSMGEKGRISRILAPLLGSYLTFAAPVKGKESAPGQITVDELRKILDIIKTGT